MRARRLLIVWAALVAVVCGRGTLAPVAFDPSVEPCRFCRMTGSTGRFAAQIVSPREEPIFFDDLGCLRDYLHRSPQSDDAVIFVADHRTGAWVAAEDAVYSKNETVATPMSSHLMAHESAESRERDPDARAAVVQAPADVFGASLPGRRK